MHRSGIQWKAQVLPGCVKSVNAACQAVCTHYDDWLTKYEKSAASRIFICPNCIT